MMGQPISVLHSASSDVAREKSPTVSPAAIRPLSTLPIPDSQTRDPLLTITNYFTVRDGKIVTLIVTLIVIRNTPASY